MKSHFAYVRVSTVKQGVHRSYLQEQRAAITAFAQRNNLSIDEEFEEQETGATIGRGEFTRMVGALKKQKASGAIFHKIESSRNLKDWSTIQDLADIGVDIRFVQESINFATNEGKPTGDFLADIALGQRSRFDALLALAADPRGCATSSRQAPIGQSALP
ncbi:recombinase family protein [Bradyrhizobium sp. CCGB01]|uniref:recombinase family protein n=1 Tax=Bradyrhizobium sp. CCGB01 TaxID=2949634 RepID=UPI0020B2A62E|nr:recombinase family protein [Bradyrhizobium sp. CCGB01]MCP3411338.1 recombinase family protein [Bradyrhizobium sp. CCGB01]